MEARRFPIAAEAEDYPEFYEERWPTAVGNRAMQQTGAPPMVRVCTEAISYVDTGALQQDIEHLRSAAELAGATEAFMSSSPPGGMGQAYGQNEFYATQDEFEEAICDALRLEYEAIVDAGFVLQLDCNWGVLSRIGPNSIEEVRRMIGHSIERMNYATRNIDPDAMRIHLCWGADEAPHHKDLPLSAIVDVMFTARPNGLGVVASNGRHEWEWELWKDTKLPDGKVLIPGVIDSTTNIIEHPETVAGRIQRFADLVGRENIIAGVDCGFATVATSTQVFPRIAWAKLAALGEGARLASSRLY